MTVQSITASAPQKNSLLKVLGPIHVWALGVGIVLVGEYMGWNFSVGMVAGLYCYYVSIRK
jgi:ethanolamine permease